jgi:hypothetical protein
MTVKELIEKLKEYDENLPVGNLDSDEINFVIVDSGYYDIEDFKHDTNFVKLT